MLLAHGLIGLGLVLLYLGGETLLRGSVGLAMMLRLTPAVIGLTVVAAGTSLPELAVSWIAAVQRQADIAVANVIGSNIFNIGFIVGMSALVRPITISGNTIGLEYPVLVLITLLCLVIAQDETINWLDAILCLAVYLAFTAYMVKLVRQQVTAAEFEELKEEVAGLMPRRLNLWICLGLTGLGLILLAVGARATVQGAVQLAQYLGWSERFIGLTIVSMGTSLPEVAASLVASFRRRGDVALANIVGSNLFNILVILGVSALASPLKVHPQLTASDCWWMLGITLALLPLMLTGLRISRMEGGILLAVYFVYLWLLVRS
ncbi:MAG: calcium/sodium antiporter [Gemmatales bacterium]|nr:calcium/sodium antiporter [Gemmatales bacterium]